MSDYDRPEEEQPPAETEDLGGPSSPQPPEPEPAPVPGPDISWRLIAFLALTVIIVVFSVQNTQDTELRFLGWTWQLPLVIIILGAVVVSVVLDEIVGGMVKRRRLRRRREQEELRKLRDDS
ncbi:MAG: lipopolysaccharide assembly LapA domain-containing protein [Actinomycetota bacterium]